MKILMMVALLSVSVCQTVWAENRTKVFFTDSNKDITYYDARDSYSSVKVFSGPIPNTSLLVQHVQNADEPKQCVTLVKGNINSKEDIQALKPESVLQMSCVVVKVGTYNWYGTGGPSQ